MFVSLATRFTRATPLKVGWMLDIAATANRLAIEEAARAGLNIWGNNDFIHRHIRPTDTVLEIGCSSGRVLAQINAAERIGVDYDREGIERGRKEHPDITFIHGNGLDYHEGADVLILSHVLEHLDDPKGFLATCRGRFDRIYIEVPDFEATPLNLLRDDLGRLLHTDPDHVFEFDRDELEALVAECGFNVVDREFRWGVLRYWIA